MTKPGGGTQVAMSVSSALEALPGFASHMYC